MSTCVCVLSNSGERLMPTFRLGKVRHLLKDGKAKIVKHHPFTIQLLYDSKTNTQPIEICEDVGYNYIGISVKSQSHEYVSAQYDTTKNAWLSTLTTSRGCCMSACTRCFRQEKVTEKKAEPRDEWGQGDSIADLYAKSGAVVSMVGSAKDLLTFLQSAGTTRHF